MDQFSRRVSGERRDFVVRSKDEAEALSLPFLPWRQAPIGTLALTDDGYVVDCLSSSIFTDKKGKTRVFKTFSIGRVFIGPGAKLRWEPRRTSGNLYATTEKSWQEKESKLTRTKNVVKLYVAQFLQGKVNWAMLGQAYRPDQKIPEATVRRLFKERKIQEMVNKEIEKAATDQGLSAAWVMEILKKAAAVAEMNGDAGSMVRAAKEVRELLDLSPKNNTPDSEQFLALGVEADLSKGMMEAAKELEGLQTKATDAHFTDIDTNGT
jgi:hypothetical protein